MSIVTSALDKLALIGAIRPKITLLVTKATDGLSHVSSLTCERGEWLSITRAEEFLRNEQARRAFNELQSRPIAR
jgi:hypothetical protein